MSDEVQSIRSANFIGFLRALTVSWKTVMSGTASVALTFLAIVLPANQYKAALFVAAGVSILWAAYEVWANERNHVVAVSEYLSHPDLLTNIVQCYRSPSPPPRLLLRLDVVNKSPTPVTVKGVKLEIIEGENVHLFKYRENATEDEAQFYVNLLGTSSFAIQKRKLSDLLDEIEAHPLERGIHKSGDLIFIFDDFARFTNPIRLRLTLIDAFGEEHRTEQSLECIDRVWMD